jgi:enamine deaminase RidA (YjgF/YER057c/UK114 family)
VGQALKNIVAILKEGGAGPQHITRMTWYVCDKQEYVAALRQVGQHYRETIGRHFPAMTAVQVADLIEDRARVEIEVTAVVPPAD